MDVSRATVRSAVASFLTPPAVTGLNHVYTAPPKVAPGQDWSLALGKGSGAVAVIHIEHEHEERIAMGGATQGWKRVHYNVALLVRFRSVKPNPVDAMTDYDTLIDNIKAKLRSDHTLGQQSGVVFSAGEEDLGITITSDMPVVTNGETHIWTAVQFTVIEIVQA